MPRKPAILVKNSKLVVTLLLLVASGLHARADFNLFLRPEAGWMQFPSACYANQLCSGIEIGHQFGSQGAHEVNLEWTRSALKYTDANPPDALPGLLPVVRLDGRWQLILLGYRYYFRPTGSTFRFFAGPSLGLAKTSGTVYAHLNIWQGDFTGTFDKWRFCTGGQVGIEMSLAPRCTLQIGYRCLIMADLGDFDASRVNPYDNVTIDTAFVGVRPMNITHFVFGALSFSF